jgi:membrane protein YqaA with SNARE-associated domain
MDNIELYKILFFDSLRAGLFFTVDYEYAIWVILSFKKLSNIWAICIVALGYSVSIVLNYLFGLLLYKISFKYSSKATEERYIKIMIYAKKYIFFLVLLTILKGFGKSIFVFLGFLNFNILSILITGTLIKVIYYILYSIYGL